MLRICRTWNSQGQRAKAQSESDSVQPQCPWLINWRSWNSLLRHFSLHLAYFSLYSLSLLSSSLSLSSTPHLKALHRRANCYTPTPATSPTANGFTNRVSSPRATTTAVRRSTKDGVALAVKNPMLLTLLSGAGNPINVISLNSILSHFFTASKTPISVLLFLTTANFVFLWAVKCKKFCITKVCVTLL